MRKIADGTMSRRIRFAFQVAVNVVVVTGSLLLAVVAFISEVHNG